MPRSGCCREKIERGCLSRTGRSLLLPAFLRQEPREKAMRSRDAAREAEENNRASREQTSVVGTVFFLETASSPIGLFNRCD